MYANEYDEFVKLLTDLCISTGRHYSDDLVRVFWDDLKHVPFPEVVRCAATLRTKGQIKFTSSDLRPAAQAVPLGWDNNAIMDRLTSYMLRHHWHGMTDLQRLYKHEYVFTSDKVAPRCVGLRILPDTIELTIDGTVHTRDVAGRYIRLEDCDLDEPMRDELRAPPPSRAREWNEADAVRDVLNRKS